MMLVGQVWSRLISVGNRGFINIPIADGITWGIDILRWRGERGGVGIGVCIIDLSILSVEILSWGRLRINIIVVTCSLVLK